MRQKEENTKIGQIFVEILTRFWKNVEEIDTKTENTMKNLKQIMDENPQLTADGIGALPGCDFDQARKDLDVCCQFLSNFPNLPTNCHSYQHKHTVESWAKENKLKPTYIPEGAFIAALLAMGVRFYVYEGGPHVVLGSERRDGNA